MMNICKTQFAPELVKGEKWPVKGNYLTIVILLLTFHLLLLTSACASTTPVLKIALVAPFEGQYRAIGYDAIYSARLAVREINGRGGIGGYRVALVALDDSGDPQLAAETAAALALDPAVLAVVGHWRPETSSSARPIYAQHNLPFLTLGEVPFVPLTPDQLPADFKEAYAAVTPFDEVADVYAGSTYDALQLLFAALEKAAAAAGPLTRNSLTNSLQNLHLNGITGTVYPNNAQQ